MIYKSDKTKDFYLNDIILNDRCIYCGQETTIKDQDDCPACYDCQVFYFELNLKHILDKIVMKLSKAKVLHQVKQRYFKE